MHGNFAAAQGMAIYLRLDEPTLREIARMTGGEYHYAGTAEKLRSLYQSLGSQLTVQTRDTELSGLMILVAALVAMAALDAVELSLVRFERGVGRWQDAPRMGGMSTIFPDHIENVCAACNSPISFTTVLTSTERIAFSGTQCSIATPTTSKLLSVRPSLSNPAQSGEPLIP